MQFYKYRKNIVKALLYTSVLLILGIAFSCDSPDSKDSKKYPEDDNSRILNAYAQQTGKLDSVPNPIDHAMSLVNLKHADLRRPLAHEEGYLLIARNPLIDHVAQSPFYLHHWADTNSTRLQERAQNGIQPVFAFLTEMLNGGGLSDGDIDPSASTHSITESYAYLCRQYGVVPSEAVLENIKHTGFSNDFDRQLAVLIVRLSQAAILTEKALAGLDQNELAFLKSRPERFFFPDGVGFNFLTAATNSQTKIVSFTRKIDFVSLFKAATHITSGIDTFAAFINSLEDISDPASYFADGRRHEGLVLEIPTPLGGIVILGQGRDLYAGSGALVVNLGGNDVYPGHLGVGHLVPGRISISIDISGNDIYDCKKNRYAQRLGVLGIGMLIDLEGQDKYLAGDMAQGSGIYGIGLVADFSGDDIYRMGLMGQGFGVFGIGLLLDTVGNDKYMIKGMGQGAGSTMGIGSLCDLSGNDKYLADRVQNRGRLIPDSWSHVQGAGLSIRSPDWTRHLSLYGGIGFLNDGGGNDFYFASDGNSMGSSYFMSIGALVDHQGNDRYIPQSGSGLGYAVHLSNAIVIDRSGNDYYFAQSHSGGVGSDRSTALLIDYAGDDVYGPSEVFVTTELKKSANDRNVQLRVEEINQQVQKKLADVSYGSALKPKALGFLIDFTGDDHYFARQKGWGESLGGVMPPIEPDNWSHAFLIDLNGTDTYGKPGRRDNHYVTYFNHGLCYDTEYTRSLEITKLQLPAFQRTTPETSIALQQSLPTALYDVVQDLRQPALFVRYQALGRVIHTDHSTSGDLIRILTISTDTELNRDLLEALVTGIINRQYSLKRNPEFNLLLSAQDPFIRQFAARTLGWFRIKSAVPPLIAALGKRNDDRCVDIIWALGRMDSLQAIAPLIKILQNEHVLRCRRSALEALSNLVRRMVDKDFAQITKSKELFVNMLTDPDEIIRTHAARALKRFGNEPDVIKSLERSLADSSVYVQRAAANSLALNGIKAGLPVLIETLRYPSIDTFAHYDQDLIKVLSYYTGVDFPEEKRYNQLTWQRWWQENGPELKLPQNIAIMEEINRAFSAPNEEIGISIFEKLIDQHPHNVVIKKRYKRFCFEWKTHRLLTQENVGEDILKRCLRIQKIAVALGPQDSQAMASLAYFLVRLNKFSEAIAAIQKAIQLDPDDTDFRKTLELYLDLQKRSEKINQS